MLFCTARLIDSLILTSSEKGITRKDFADRGDVRFEQHLARYSHLAPHTFVYPPSTHA